ncbi:hypothetical protein NPIL_608791 [Nephila pilipes]|uniref:Uncharacterized protein n=1 Tax=Nephila pilipes TaxID=299642 RepID=A0A8X6KQW9_NEPPI|nr:hypothetical protein NPIL_608791 [Nephila pilipes]
MPSFLQVGTKIPRMEQKTARNSCQTAKGIFVGFKLGSHELFPRTEASLNHMGLSNLIAGQKKDRMAAYSSEFCCKSWEMRINNNEKKPSLSI